MSYINDALNRAQKEKDRRYERFGDLIGPHPQGLGRPRRRSFALAAGAGFLLLIAAGLLATFLFLRPAILPEGGQVPEAKAPAPEAAAAPQGGGDAGPAEREAEQQFQAAVAAQRQGDLKGAEGLYGQVLRMAPDHVQALNNLGVLYMGQKQRKRAIALFSRAVVLKRDYVDPYYNLACLYAQTREIDESLWYLKIAVAINGEVRTWAEKDADLREIVATPAFKQLMEGQKN